MTNQELFDLIRPLCEALGVDPNVVTQIYIDPSVVTVEYLDGGDKRTVSRPVTYTGDIHTG